MLGGTVAEDCDEPLIGSELLYCGPVLRHPAEFMLPAVDLGGRVWLVASPVKAGLRPPPSAADGLDRTCHPTIVATKNSTARSG